MTPSAADTEARPQRHCPLGPWLAVLLGAGCYLNTLGNGFTCDDVYIVVFNPRVNSPATLGDIWLSDWWRLLDERVDEKLFRDRLYRPLTLWSFRLNYAALGRDVPPTRPEQVPAWSFHLVNVLLHAGVSGLVWLLAWRLVGDRAVAGIAAVLFAVHPVHVEAVAGIVGRAELLSALFLLLGLAMLRPGAGSPGAVSGVAAALAFLAALLSKEHAICYPALALLVLYAGHRRAPLTARQWVCQATLLALPAVVYFPLRYVALDGQLLRPAPTNSVLNPLVEATSGQRVVGILTALGHYARLLLLPARLRSDYGWAVIDPRAGFTAMTAVGVVAAGGLVIGLLGVACRRRVAPASARAQELAGPGAMVALLAGMTLASYALISNTFLLIGVAVAERILYWPSVPALILVALGVARLWRWLAGGPDKLRARRLTALGGFVVAALAVRTVVRNADWADNLTLTGRDVRANPQSAVLNQAYALSLMWLAEEVADPARQAEILRDAEHHLTAALRIYPTYAGALALRARIRAHFGEADAARADAETALLLEPNHASALYVLSHLRGDSGPRRAELDGLEAAVRQRPTDVPARVALAAALLENGRAAAALRHLEQARTVAPDNRDVLQMTALALTASGRRDEAIAAYEQVLAAEPDNWTAHVNLALLLLRRDGPSALRHARRAYELNPADLRSGLTLGEVLTTQRRTGEARALYERLLQHLAQSDPRRDVVQGRLDRLPPARQR